MNAFTLMSKSPSNFIALGLAIIFCLYILYVSFLWVRIDVKRKWLWLIFIFIGITGNKLYWTLGKTFSTFSMIFFSVVFPPFKIEQIGIIAPYTLIFSLPIGAIWFHFKYRKKGEIENGKEKQNRGLSSNLADDT
jgi:hypothetical protein